MLITIIVEVPDGNMCEGCRFLEFQEHAFEYKCVLFNEWELSRDNTPVTDSRQAFKCEDCLACIHKKGD